MPYLFYSSLPLLKVWLVVPVLFILLLNVLAFLFIELFLMFLVLASHMISLKGSIVEKLEASQKIELKDDDAE
jgi:uncharacterized membrane protein